MLCCRVHSSSLPPSPLNKIPQRRRQSFYVSFCISASIRIGREIRCLLYAGFLLNTSLRCFAPFLCNKEILTFLWYIWLSHNISAIPDLRASFPNNIMHTRGQVPNTATTSVHLHPIVAWPSWRIENIIVLMFFVLILERVTGFLSYPAFDNKNKHLPKNVNNYSFSDFYFVDT